MYQTDDNIEKNHQAKGEAKAGTEGSNIREGATDAWGYGPNEANLSSICEYKVQKYGSEMWRKEIQDLTYT